MGGRTVLPTGGLRTRRSILAYGPWRMAGRCRRLQWRPWVRLIPHLVTR